MNEEKQEKRARKPFDSSVCFTFFGSWLNFFDGLNDASHRELFNAVANYSLYGEQPVFTTDGNTDKLNAAWFFLQQDIDRSIERRKRGFAKEGKTPTQQAAFDACVEHPELSNADIARIANCGPSTVDRVRHRFKPEIAAAIAAKAQDSSCQNQPI